MRLLLTGAGGQLAQDLIATFDGWDLTALDRRALDSTSAEQIEAALRTVRPDVVLNTAAYTSVDRAESEPDAAVLVNAVGPHHLAAACERHGILLVHYSTDYVFDGEKGTPYDEDDPMRPLSVYGVSKAAGEMAVRAATQRHLIVRTTGLYGHGGRATGRGNFLETMLRVGASGKPLKVVADQILTPTATADLAAATRALLVADARGTVHVTNSGSCSWYEFAREIFRLAGMQVQLQPTTQADRPLPARRPAYSVLGHRLLLDLGLPDLPAWQDALSSYLRARAVTR